MPFTTSMKHSARDLRAQTPEPCDSRPMRPPPPPTWKTLKQDASSVATLTPMWKMAKKDMAFVIDEPYLTPKHSNQSSLNLLEDAEEEEDYYAQFEGDDEYDDSYTDDVEYANSDPSPSPESTPPARMSNHLLRIVEQLKMGADEHAQFEARRTRKKVLEQWERAFPLIKDVANTPEMRDAMNFFRIRLKFGLMSCTVITAFDIEVAAFAGRTGGRLRKILSNSTTEAQNVFESHNVLGALVGRLLGKRKRQDESSQDESNQDESFIVDRAKRDMALMRLSQKTTEATKLEMQGIQPGPDVPPIPEVSHPSSSSRVKRAWRPMAGCARVARAVRSFLFTPPQDAPLMPIPAHPPSVIPQEIVDYAKAKLFNLTKEMDRRLALVCYERMTSIARQTLQENADLGYIERGRSPAVKPGVASEPRRPSAGPVTRGRRRV